MVTKPTEKVWWICSSVQAGPSGPASALSKTQARVRVRAAALPLETIWSSCCRSSAARVMTYFLFMAEVPVRKDRFPPLYGSLPTFQYNLDKALVQGKRAVVLSEEGFPRCPSRPERRESLPLGPAFLATSPPAPPRWRELTPTAIRSCRCLPFAPEPGVSTRRP